MRKRIEEAIVAAEVLPRAAAPGIAMRLRATADDAHRDGRADGRPILRWIDDAVCACGTEWTGAQVITAYIAGIRLLSAPFSSTSIIEVSARIIHTGPRSIHTAIRVTATDTNGGQQRVWHRDWSSSSHWTTRQSPPVPQWEPESHEDRRFDQHARQLIELRQFAEPFTAATVA